VVILYYSTETYTYIQPTVGSAGLLGKAITILYSTVIPSLNPLIHTMKNKGFKATLEKLFSI
jgi:olfactory receptor